MITYVPETDTTFISFKQEATGMNRPPSSGSISGDPKALILS